jgi:Na+-transporting methylmalonyl-CoA/oxaloacetate decarboxylase gamma subunit
MIVHHTITLVGGQLLRRGLTVSVWPLALVIIFLVIVVLVISQIGRLLSSFGGDSPKRTLAGIEATLGVHVPSDASDLVYDGERGYAAYITLSFKAAPQGVLEFAKHICDGALHQGYDPYNALNTSQKPPQKPYLIKYDNFNFSYYSYSPDTSSTIWGNRCWPFRDGLHQIRIDKINPQQYSLQFDQLNQHSPLWGEDRQCNVIPCSSIGDNFIQPAQIKLPLMIMGMGIDDDGQYVLVTDEICLEFQLGYVLGFGWNQVEKWKHLVGANVDIMIDGMSQGTAYIAENERLTRAGNQDTNFHYGYCIIQDWTRGNHTMTMNIVPLNGQSETYSWDFLVT